MKSEERSNRRTSTEVPSRHDHESDRGELARVPLWKRFLDLSLIAFAAPAWVPLMLGIGAAIKILSPGPVLFRQVRIGLGGKHFVCLKFRTMHAGTNTVVHEKHLVELMKSNRPMTKLDGHDPRLIPLARLLRSSGFDELPQLLNVIRGEMSIIGPRPCTPREYEAYSEAERARTGTLPGLTGLWQVNGKNHTTFSEMIELDVRYLNTKSLWLDLVILFRTPVALFSQVREIVMERKANGLSTGAKPPRSIVSFVEDCGDSARATQPAGHTAEATPQ